MSNITTETLDGVRDVLISSLELQQTPADLQPDTPLFGALPELDSLGVLALVTDLEERFDITVDDEEFGADLFETVGTLTDFVEAKLRTR
jgi:acyl carrier protein